MFIEQMPNWIISDQAKIWSIIADLLLRSSVGLMAFTLAVFSLVFYLQMREASKIDSHRVNRIRPDVDPGGSSFLKGREPLSITSEEKTHVCKSI